MFTLKRKMLTTTLACCVLSSVAYGNSDITRLSKKQGKKLHEKNLKLRKSDNAKRIMRKNKDIGKIASMANDVNKVMRASLNKTDPKLMKMLREKSNQISRSKLSASKKNKLMHKLISPHRGKFKAAYFEASSKFPGFEKYINKLSRSTKKIVKVGDMGSVSVINKHEPSTPSGPRSFEITAPYTYETTEFSGTASLGSASVNLEQGRVVNNLVPLVAGYKYAEAGVSEIIHIEPGYSTMRISSHVAVDYRQIIGAMLGFSFASTDVFLSAYGDNEKKCQINTQIASTFGALLWVVENNGTELIPITCEFEVDNRGSEYSITVGASSVAMTIGYVAMTNTRGIIDHISVELFD
jgi:hypothetical protein